MKIKITNNMSDATRIPHQYETESFREYEDRNEALRKAASEQFGQDLGWTWDSVTPTDAVARLYRERREDDPADAPGPYRGIWIGYLKVACPSARPTRGGLSHANNKEQSIERRTDQP